MFNKEDGDSLTNLSGKEKAIIIQISSGASRIMTEAKGYYILEWGVHLKMSPYNFW
jgi:hypothetical protein